MKRSFVFTLAITLLAACSTKEIDIQTPVQDDVVFYASFEQSTDEGTRVYANENLLLRWTADDRVTIFNKNTYNQQYKFLGETGDNSGGFTKADGAEFVTGNPLSHVVSVYPYQESTKITEEEVVTLSLPAEQHYAENTFGLGANTMVSVSSDNFLQYKNVGGYLRISLYGAGVSVSSITLKGNDGEKLAGRATVTMPLDGDPSVVMGNEAVKEITLVCDTPVTLGANAEESKEFWFVVPPMTFNKGFSISITEATGGVVQQSTSKSITIERSKLTKMSPMEVESTTPPIYDSYISIDGDFSDWDYLNASKVSIAISDPNSPWDAVKEIRVYADEHYVFFYLEYNDVASLLADTNGVDGQGNKKVLPIRLILNTDGELTSGYHNFCLDSYDFIIEGGIASNGEWSSFDGGWWQRINNVWVSILESGSGLCFGAGNDNRYEIALSRAIFNETAMKSTVPMPMSDTFQAGVHFYTPDWGELARMPDGAVTDDNTKGWGHLLNVITDKRSSSLPLPEAVDLGLPSGLKWASFNLGATKPEEYGDYYAWGEIEPYYSSQDPLTWKDGKEAGYSWDSYKFVDQFITVLKYVYTNAYGTVDKITTLEAEDDAATMNLGGNWRMPTNEEWTELQQNCTWTWVEDFEKSGVAGCLITSNIEGYTNKSIFLPAAGGRGGMSLTLPNARGYYWSSSLYKSNSKDAYYLWMNSTSVEQSNTPRYYGSSIRPVSD